MDGKAFGLLPWFGWLSDAAAQNAPFGLCWGAETEVPKPSVWSTGKRKSPL